MPGPNPLRNRPSAPSPRRRGLSFDEIEISDSLPPPRSFYLPGGAFDPSAAGVFFLRFFLGAILLATSLGKMLDVPGFELVLKTYQVLPLWLLKPVALGMVLVELKLAEAFLTDRKLASTALVSTCLHGAFILWSGAALMRGLHIANCGCFGVFLVRPLSWGTIAEDVVMMGLSWILYRIARR